MKSLIPGIAVLFVLFLVFFFSGAGFATQDSSAPANWDNFIQSPTEYQTYRTNAMVEWDGSTSLVSPWNYHWKFEWQGVYEDDTNFCVGIGRFSTMALDEGDDPPGDASEGWGWFYYATPRQSGNDCTGGQNGMRQDPFGENTRPGLLFLHGQSAESGDDDDDDSKITRGSLVDAVTFARIFSSASNPVVAMTISAPGQGYDCNGDDSGTEECIKYPFDQITHGHPMIDSNGGSAAYRYGFAGYASQEVPEPDSSYFWSYTMAGMRVVNFFDKVIGPDYLNWTNGNLVVAGFSMGGVVAQLVNGNEDNGRVDGAIALFSGAQLDEMVNLPGNWYGFGRTAETGDDPYNPFYSFDCDEYRSDDDDYQEAEDSVCQMNEYFEPTQFEPSSPLLLIAGAQDGAFPAAAVQATYDAYSS